MKTSAIGQNFNESISCVCCGARYSQLDQCDRTYLLHGNHRIKQGNMQACIVVKQFYRSRTHGSQFSDGIICQIGILFFSYLI